MGSPASAQKTTEVSRPKSSQHVSVSWNDSSDSTAPLAASLQFEVAECVETKTVTTTTTTKRSYPPLYVREPRHLHSLNAKDYPLASKPTPPELSRITFDLDCFPDTDALPSLDDLPKWSPLHHKSSAARDLSLQRQDKQSDDCEPFGAKLDPDATNDLLFQHGTKSTTADISTRKPRSKSLATSPRPYAEKKVARPGSSALLSADSNSPRHGEDVANNKDKELSEGDELATYIQPSYLSTPDNSGMVLGNIGRTSRLRSLRLSRQTDGGIPASVQPSSAFDAASPANSDTHTVFSNSVATPPILEADTDLFADSDESLQQTVRALPPRVLGNVAVLDASLPSPRLSPTLSAAHPAPPNLQEEEPDEFGDVSFTRQLIRQQRPPWGDDSQSTEAGEGLSLLTTEESYLQKQRSTIGGRAGAKATFFDTRELLERFDAMPNEMKTVMMYQFLRRCSRKTLHVVANVVNPALQCDFLKQLPLELSLHILSYLDFRDLCRAAQVSKHWRSIVDSNETGWKELFDRDGFELPLGELQTAIAQGWGWQDPVGPEGCEADLSLRNRMSSTETELIRSVKPETPLRIRGSKRKRGIASFTNSERSKRRAGVQDLPKDEPLSRWPYIHKSEGPLSAANAAVLAVPDPQIGLPSLRKLHLFKSLYRRHYMIRQSWTSGKVKPGHVAFAAHPRHVITCLQFDDDKIITGSDDTLIHVYDTKTGKLRKKLEGHEGGVWALQYEGNVLVSGSTDRSVRVWDIEKGLCTQVFYGHTSTVRCLQILMPTPTGKVEEGRPVMVPPKPLIITGSRDNQLRVWRLPEPGSRRYIQTGPPANDLECPYFIRILSGHTSSVRSIAAHGDILVSGSYDSTVRVWRISTGEALHVLHGHNQRVYSVVLDTKRNRCISGSMDASVKIWDLETGTCLHTLEGHAHLVGLLDLRDEKLVSAAADSTLRVWDPETGRCKSTLTAHTGAITCFQHDGRKVISGSEKTVKMWDARTGECIQDLLSDLSGVWQVRFDGRRCVAAVQRDNLTYVEILDFGAVRDGKPPEDLGKRIVLNATEVQALMDEDI